MEKIITRKLVEHALKSNKQINRAEIKTDYEKLVEFTRVWNLCEHNNFIQGEKRINAVCSIIEGTLFSEIYDQNSGSFPLLYNLLKA